MLLTNPTGTAYGGLTETVADAAYGEGAIPEWLAKLKRHDCLEKVAERFY